jgi:hypothetical protein
LRSASIPILSFLFDGNRSERTVPKANNPINIGIGSIPPLSSTTPNVSLGAPEDGSIPGIDNKAPANAAMIPFKKEPSVITAMSTNAIIIRAK